MAHADANRVRISYQQETVIGTPEVDSMQQLRLTQSSLAAEKDTVVSDELRSDRMVSDLVEVAARSGGDIGIELSLTTFEDMLQAALGGTWSTAVDLSSLSLTVTSTTDIEDAGAASSFTNIVVGQWIKLGGFVASGNNRWVRVTAKTDANNIEVTPALTNEVGSGNTLKAKMLRNGTTNRGFTLEQYFADINIAQRFSGQQVGALSLDFSTGQIVTGSITFGGREMVAKSGAYASPTPTAATTTDVVNSTSDVSDVWEGNAASSVPFMQISLSLDNGLRDNNVIGSKFPAQINLGRQNVSGQVEAYFEDLTLYNKFLNHTSTDLSWTVSDGTNDMRITIPKLHFSTDAPAPEGIDTDIMEVIDFQAIAYTDASGDYQIQIDVA